MNRLLTRVFVAPFYRQHAGLLLFLLLVCFGTVQASSLADYHRAIMRALLSAPIGLAALLLLWTAWYARALRSGLRLLASPEGSFLHQLRGLSRWRQFGLFGSVAVQWMALVLGYAAALAVFGIHEGLVLPALVVIAFHLLALPATTLLLCGAINRASVPRRPLFPGGHTRRRPLPFALWPLRQLWAGARRTYVVVKLFSFIL
ncbi:MAG: hypothetical protein EOO16_11365, partial [Chitinophagaceae bacterium]